MPSSASPLELAWTASASLGTIGGLLLLLLRSVDLVAIYRGRRNGSSRRYARALLREALRKVVTHAVFVAVGVVALFTPPPAHPANQHAAVFSAVAFTGLNGYLTADTLWLIWDEYRNRIKFWFLDRAFPPSRGE